MANRRTIAYLILLAAVIPLGLGSRMVAWIPEQTGDALWTMALFCVLRLMLPKTDVRTVAVSSFVLSVLDELSQLIRFEWLDQIRATTIGHLLLGQGFDPLDIAAYAIGALVIWGTASLIEKGIKQ